jgi:hypothetical protein
VRPELAAAVETAPNGPASFPEKSTFEAPACERSRGAPAVSAQQGEAKKIQAAASAAVALVTCLLPRHRAVITLICRAFAMP